MDSSQEITVHKNAPKTAVIGAAGYIGRALFSGYTDIYSDTIGTTKNKDHSEFAYLDLLSCDTAPLKLAESGYKDAVITAGIARLFECEKDREYSREIVEGTMELVRQLVNDGIKPIYISSDYVFDGQDGLYDDDAAARPVNEYGRHKAEIEQRIKDMCNGNYLIARLAKVFTLDKNDGTIFDEMASVLISGGTIRAAYDQIFSPTYLPDVINALTVLQSNGATGTFNICSPEVWSRYDLAVMMADHLGIDRKNIQKISLDDLKETFQRPKNTNMNVGKLLKETGCQFTPVKQCIEQVAENWKVSSIK